MSIIPCPQCHRKMSSHAAFCSRCGYTEGEISDEQRHLMRSRKLRDMIYRLSMAGYAVISFLLTGFGWFWWSSGGFEHRAATGSIILMVVAALAYVVVRALLFRNRQRLSALRRKKAS